jgi:hypothetical protein
MDDLDSQPKSSRSRNLPTPVLVVLITVWLALAGLGTYVMLKYEWSPGPSSEPQAVQFWPASSKLQRSLNSTTLVMFVHPECPCTRASINELSKLYTQAKQKPKVIVAFVDVFGNHQASDPSNDKWVAAQGIPGASVISDAEANEWKRFGAVTSGQCFVYSPGGSLCFSGGITGGRGHEGDNQGLDSALAAVNGESKAILRAPVFGCLLVNKE